MSRDSYATTIDVLIVGGGLAGSVAAIVLARAGCKVTLIEKESKPHHKVCGEFLSAEALHYLSLLGVDVAALGAVPIPSVRLAGRWRMSQTRLPFAAMSLTRYVLDEELLCCAESAGVSVMRGCKVTSLEPAVRGYEATLADESSIVASTAFLATGKHELRGRVRPAGVQSGLIAFKMYWHLASEQASELAGNVELCLYRGGYAGLQPMEDGAANLTCLVQQSEFQRVGRRWEALLASMQQDCPHLKRRLNCAEKMLSRPLAIAAIPYGFVREHADGIWALGDQAAVIPSFTGDGMSIALYSGLLAAQMYLRGEAVEAFQQRLCRQLSKQVAFATRLSRGLIHGPTRSLMEAVVKAWPGALQRVANQTRLRIGVDGIDMVAANASLVGS